MLLNLKTKYCEDVNLLLISVDSIKIPVWLLFLANKSDFLMKKNPQETANTHKHTHI